MKREKKKHKKKIVFLSDLSWGQKGLCSNQDENLSWRESVGGGLRIKQVHSRYKENPACDMKKAGSRGDWALARLGRTARVLGKNSEGVVVNPFENCENCRSAWGPPVEQLRLETPRGEGAKTIKKMVNRRKCTETRGRPISTNEKEKRNSMANGRKKKASREMAGE